MAATTLLSDNGVSSGITGYQLTGGDDGTLQLQTTTAGGTATTAMTITASQNVGIGTSSPAEKLAVTNTSLTSTTLGANTVAAFRSNASGADAHIKITDGTTYSSKFGQVNGNIYLAPNDTQQFNLTTSGLLQFNSGYGSVATAYGCRAWVNFNGTGTVAIRASGNVSSITDNGVGDYTVNFTTAMPDSDYSASAFGVADAVNQTVVGTNIGFHPTGTSTWIPSLKTTTQARIIVGRGNAAGLYDISNVSFQIFR